MSLPGNALFIIYKCLIRFHLDYVDILYDEPNTDNLERKLEKVQYRSYIEITGAIQETSRANGYDNVLGLHWSLLIFDLLSQINHPLRPVSASIIKPVLSRTKSFKNTVSRYCINKWNNVTVEIRNSKSVSTFKKLIKCKKKIKKKMIIIMKAYYSQSMMYSALNSLPPLVFKLVI